MVKKQKESMTHIKLRNFFKNNSVLLIFLVVIVLLAIFSIVFSSKAQTQTINKIYGDDVIEMYYFHLTTCPHCIEQNKFMKDELFVKYPNIRLNSFEMTKKESYLKYQEMANSFVELDPNNFPGTPLTIIGDKTNIGFGTAATTGPKIIAMVEEEQKRINSNWNSSMKRTVDLNK